MSERSGLEKRFKQHTWTNPSLSTLVLALLQSGPLTNSVMDAALQADADTVSRTSQADHWHVEAQRLEAEAAVLRHALERLLTGINTGRELVMGDVVAYEGRYHKTVVQESWALLQGATAGQSILDELQQLRQREAGLKSFLGVLAKEMETFCEVTAFAPDALDAALNTMHRWQGLIEAACKGTETNPNE